jgi:hypothetical protein
MVLHKDDLLTNKKKEELLKHLDSFTSEKEIKKAGQLHDYLNAIRFLEHDMECCEREGKDNGPGHVIRKIKLAYYKWQVSRLES